MIKLKVFGVQGTMKKLASINVLIRNANAQTIKETALQVQSRAQEIAPVDTGRLRASIQVQEYDPLTPYAIVGTDVEYAVYVEFGTWKSTAQPFMRPAALGGQTFIQARTRANIVRSLKSSLLAGVTPTSYDISVREMLASALGGDIESLEFGESFKNVDVL